MPKSNAVSSSPSKIVAVLEQWEVLTIVAGTLIAQGLLRNSDLEEQFSRLPIWLRVPVLTIPILCLFMVPGDQRAFIYFQF